MPKNNNYKITNIVKIGGGAREKREQYCYAILMRMSPHIYNQKEHKCIKIQVRESLLEYAEAIINKFRCAGLKEISRKRKEIEADRGGYSLPEAYEIVLKKIPVLEMMEEDGDI